MVCSIGLGLQQEGISFGVGWEWMSPSLPESGWWILSPWADLQLSGWCWNWMVFFAGDTQTLHTKGCSLQCSPVMLWHAVYPPLTSIIIVSWDVVVDLTQVHVTGCRYFLVTIFGLCGTAKLTANLNSQYISLKLLWSSSVSCDFLLFTFQPDSGALFLTLSEWIPVALPETIGIEVWAIRSQWDLRILSVFHWWNISLNLRGKLMVTAEEACC